jgi:integrase
VIDTFSQAHLQSYRSALQPSEEWKLATLSGFFRRWSAQGHPGVDPAAVKFLEELTLKGNFKGVAVSTSDPATGPFTVVEASAISTAVSDALATGRMSLRQYCITVLMAALGSRAVQFAALKCCDLRPPDPKGDSTQWILDVPRAKQRHQPARTQFKPRPLVPEIAELLRSQIEDVKQEAVDIDGTDMDPSQLPIFPNWTAIGAPNLKYHSTGTELGSELSAALKTINARSERTGEAIAITARRFRYTVGTRAAEEGLGEYVIAELLDHTDVQQVAVYVMATQKIVERIEKAVAMHLAPLAQAFAGELISDEREAVRGDDPKSRIRDRDTMACVGNCGRHSFCSASAPIACYTCRRFQAWVDAPHDQILDGLLQERDRVLQITGDLRVASVNDRTILAVAQVVHLCHARRQGDSGAL